MNKAFKNFIKRLQDIRLSESEKSILRSKISEFISFNPIRGEAHIPRERMYISIFEVNHFAKATALVLVFAIVVGGSGVSYAASNALPGEALYSIKVNVNEKIEGSLAFSTGTKVAVESKKVERRLEEAQALVQTNMLSTENKELLQKKIEEHIEELEEKIDDLKKDGDFALVLETTGKLTPVLEIHKDILIEKSLDENKDTEDSGTLIATVEHSIERVIAEENNVLAFALDTDPSLDTPSTESMSLMVAQDTVLEKSAEEIAEEQITKDAREAIEEISDDIQNIVEDRIKSAKDKIRTLKAEQLLIEKEIPVKTEQSAVINAPDTTPVELPSASIASKTETVIEFTESMSIEPKESLPVTTDETTLQTFVFDIDTKIKEAEDLINTAEEYAERGRYKEALSIAQNVNRIASEIETYKKLKELELAQMNIKKAELKATVAESVKTE